MSEETTLSARRRDRVVAAATDVFLRYGYARTTMGDIAQATGLSRPTLYLTFPDKESIFRAVIETMAAVRLAAIHQGLAASTTLGAKLCVICEAWAADGFELVLANPDAKDMFDLSFAPVRECYAIFEAQLVDLLKEPLQRIGMGDKATELARVLVYSTRGFKDASTDGTTMRRMIRTQIAVISALLD